MENNTVEYLGYREIELDDDALADFYADMYDLSFLNVNEYGLIKNNGEIIEKI